MRITDLNSGREIGANCMLAEFGGVRVVIDSGLHPKLSGRAALPQFDKIQGGVDGVILTHCHLDHLGSLPLLIRQHPGARVYASAATTLFVRRLLNNSIQVMKRQREETGITDYPLYVETDVERVENALAAVPIANPRIIGRGGEEIAITFHLAGHVAGAVGCLIEHRRKRHFFTGDVNFQAQRTVAGANFPRQPVDTLVMECTRGATKTIPTMSRSTEEKRLLKTINEVADRGGSVLLPAFAFGRMQEILLFLQDSADAGNLADVPIFCSGLGMDLCDYLDAASKKTKQVKFSRQVLRDLNVLPLSRRYTQPGKNMPEAGIYLLSSGMLVEKTPAWRVAANILDHEENAVLFVGYCDPETPGGELIGMAPGGEFKFKSLDHISTLRAQVERFHLSGHADREELIDFAKDLAPKDIILTHGDPPARAWMKETLAKALPATRVHDPEPGIPIDL
ncbi:MAG: MBL fold metallo-hydrolase [Verrucomicrobiota bacterium]